ncbi:uncharacterized protein Ice2 [Chironomus tepperi]|uniref:uncharacterized protein Ice2 n=1 Tax=Chironomus tepperi TaxID=113505 RepID=UPI00391F1AAA
MEQFKQLKWSWHKYEEDKKYLPRVFNFETINDNDSLTRNLNEIHTCVIPEQSEYRIFKTPEEIAANCCEVNSSEFVELKDPRVNKCSKLESSRVMIKEYSYPSELKKNEQIMILRNLISDTIHNPKYLQTSIPLERSIIPLSKELEENWKKEASKFSRCAEIYYHRHITQFNNLVCDKFKEILFDKWKRIEAQFPYLKYKAITMIVRNSCTMPVSNINFEHIDNTSDKFQHELYKIPDELFPNLQDVSVESIKLFTHFKDLFYVDNTYNTRADIQISLDVLTKLFVDGTEFNTNFINESGITKFILNETVPLKTITQSDALEEAIKLIMHFNIEWHNASKNVAINDSKKIDFKPNTINETMSKIFKSYKKHAGANNEISLWKLEKNAQTLLISISNNSSYYINDETRAILSIKFEYQTNFGAEQMSKEELLNEWIQIKFSLNTIIMRYRINVKSMEILSAIKLNIEDIEKELREIYNYDPGDSMDILFNVFNCIHNLPQSRYIIQGIRNDKECNKLVVYKEVEENGKIVTNDEEFKIIESFTRKWVPISKTVTFLHLNEELAPCCFSYKSSRKISYPASKNKNVTKKKAIEHKLPQKTKLQRKRTKRKKNKVTQKA